MDWELACHELLICQHQGLIFSKFGSTGKTILLIAEAISTSEVLKYPLTETPH